LEGIDAVGMILLFSRWIRCWTACKRRGPTSAHQLRLSACW